MEADECIIDMFHRRYGLQYMHRKPQMSFYERCEEEPAAAGNFGVLGIMASLGISVAFSSWYQKDALLSTSL